MLLVILVLTSPIFTYNFSKPKLIMKNWNVHVHVDRDTLKKWKHLESQVDYDERLHWATTENIYFPIQTNENLISENSTVQSFYLVILCLFSFTLRWKPSSHHQCRRAKALAQLHRQICSVCFSHLLELLAKISFRRLNRIAERFSG